jgi:hypothetical protein
MAMRVIYLRVRISGVLLAVLAASAAFVRAHAGEIGAAARAGASTAECGV